MLDHAQRLRSELRRAVTERRSIRNPAPARCATQPDRNQLRNPLQYLGQRLRVVDIFQNPASPVLHVGQRADLAAVLALQVPSSRARCERQEKQQSGKHRPVANVLPRRLGEHSDIVRRAQQNIEVHVVPVGTGFIDHANVFSVGVEMRHYRLEGDKQPFARLGIAELVNGLQRSQRRLRNTPPAEMLAKKMAAAETSRLVKSNFASLFDLSTVTLNAGPCLPPSSYRRARKA